jgi:hypothetical protein
VKYLVALDATSGKSPWCLPKGGRTALKVTSVWDGAVYGTTSNGPVVLDGRTGRDRQETPGIAPLVADAYAGIAVDETSGQVMIYPATG